MHLITLLPQFMLVFPAATAVSAATSLSSYLRLRRCFRVRCWTSLLDHNLSYPLKRSYERTSFISWRTQLASSHWQSSPRSSLSSSLISLRGGSEHSIAALEFPLPPSFDRKEDVNRALLAVLAACRVTHWLQPTGNLPSGSTSGNTPSIATLSKQDASPVTVGDFASQALALHILYNQFPFDTFIAEEGSEALQKDPDMLDRVWDAVDIASSNLKFTPFFRHKEELLRAIDYGQGIPSPPSSAQTPSKRRVWCLDPIDGTKGFLRGKLNGGQYCVALALLDDGVPVCAILGCPNLPISVNRSDDAANTSWSQKEMHDAALLKSGDYPTNMFTNDRGCLFVAVRGCGCYEIPIYELERLLLLDKKEESMTPSTWKKIHVTSHEGTSKTPLEATFCLGVERNFSDPNGTVLKMAQFIHGGDALIVNGDDGIPDIKNSFRLDGQGKYGILARGEAEYFVRLPSNGYIDWVWDVAPGHLILTEAGGMMTDLNGNSIDFTGIGINREAKLPQDVRGLLVSCGGIFHKALLEAYVSVEKNK